MKSYEKLLVENKKWVAEKLKLDPSFFSDLAEVQKPEFLWIGCSDSRVDASEITNMEAGNIFVHRNIANLVVHTDLNVMSVVQYAVEVLKVKHIIVCGHYHCGGVKAAMNHQDMGLINKWLRNIKDIYRLHQDKLEAIPDYEDRVDRLVELNVQEQVLNLVKTSIIQKAWKSRSLPSIHGWVYGIETGILNQICMLDADTKIDDIFKFNL